MVHVQVVGDHAQRSGAPGGVRRGGAIQPQNRVLLAKHQLLNSLGVFRQAVDGQVGLSGLSLHQAALGQLDRPQDGRTPLRVLVNAHTEVDLLGIGVGFEGLCQA